MTDLNHHIDKENCYFSLESVDTEGFLKELKAIKKEIDQKLGEEDLVHLRKMERWGRAFTAMGALTAGIAPNPFSMICLSLGRSNRWVMMHHINHRGYDKVPNVPEKYTSQRFGKGKRRFLDWADWLDAEAWAYEHNVLHHAHTAEIDDPDLIEHNTQLVRELGLPKWARYASLGAVALMWRPGAYAPNAIRALKLKNAEDKEKASTYDFKTMLQSFFDKDYWLTGVLPYSALQFGAFPLLYSPLGPWSVFSAFCNSVGAEIVYNAHAFAVVLPNHCGEDLYRYDERPASRAERKIRQIVSSANYRTGTDWQGFSQLWLNYQIEHHIWPDIPMLKYRQYQPRVKALCEKYGVPYVQESLMQRVKRMADVVVGDSSMKRVKGLSLLSKVTRRGNQQVV